MSTTITLFPTLFLWLLLLFAAVAVNLGFCNATTGWSNGTIHQTRCIPSEREALLEFKKHLKDPLNKLSTWAADNADCCSWYAVSCHHHRDSIAQYVLGLHRRSPSFYEYYADSLIDGDYDYEQTLFGGKISSVLLNLKHLMYLDLSCNDIRGIPIPAFLGSMGSLRFLNLSNAGFGGMIPHQLGNLSNLQYLDLHNDYYDAQVENLNWLSGLSSLKFLDLSRVNLSKASNWDNDVATTLPSLLEELHLSYCQLPYPQPHLLNNINSSSISLAILDLSFNNLGHEDSTRFFSWVSGLKSLRSLNLEGNEFQGSVPGQLQNMSSLRELYLGNNEFNSSVPNWLYGHTKLKVLSLHHNHLSSFQPQSSSTTSVNFSSLSVLDMSWNQFQGPIPNELQKMASLQKLDLSFNEFSSPIPNWLYGFTRLEHLNINGNNLEGKISSAIGNLTSLITLDMSQPLGHKLELGGGIPMSFKNFYNLRELDLSGVILRQDISQVFEILSSSPLSQLGLSGCQLFGDLATTNQHLGQLMSLKSLYLSNNSLNGTLPVSVGRLNKLERLYLFGNSLVGNVSEAHFENLTSLQDLQASGNQLKLRVSPNWIPPFADQVRELELGSWHIGPQFPTWLRSLESLESLDLSNSGISSTIPVWFWKLSYNLKYFNLSHNQIHGVLPTTLPPVSAPFSTFFLIDFSSNRFHGPLPRVSSDLLTLNLSNNSFTGSISNFLCRQTMRMQDLNLAQNLLSGEIPNCWTAWPSLVIVHFSNNKLNGTIPESIGTLGSLESLHLRNNSLSGEVPLSLRKCTILTIIDVGENKLVGNISNRISHPALSGMKILNFRSNKLSGPIPEELCHATSLHILDFANNFFSGIIPNCFSNLTAMARLNESTGVLDIEDDYSSNSISETALLQMKGEILEYTTNLGYVRSLDLSNNRLCGEIPDEITSLRALLSLNLSHNALSGGIPRNIDSMKALESLDLSANHLSGEIPQSMATLTFLGHLNLSHNNLSGSIPSGTQIQGFEASSFVGNELCGRPLPKSCSVDPDVIPNDARDEGGEDDDGGDGMVWFYVSMAFGFVVGFWGFVGPLFFNMSWRVSYFQFLDRLWNRIWWRLHKDWSVLVIMFAKR